MKKVRIGVIDHETEYVTSLITFLQKYSKGKWDLCGFTNEQALVDFTDKKSLDLLVGTDRKILHRAGMEKDLIRLWLGSGPCDLEEIESKVYMVYRFQSANEIGKRIERVIQGEKKDVEDNMAWVAIYSPVGRCGKTTLALDVVKDGMFGNWLYLGMEDYSSFEDTGNGKRSFIAEQVLYYWKERKGDKLLQLIGQAEGILPTGGFPTDRKQIDQEDMQWLKEVLIPSRYRGIICDIGSGILQDLQMLEVFDAVIVPYVTEERALVKKSHFEKLMEQRELTHILERVWFVNMGVQKEIRDMKNKMFGGETG